MRNLPIRRYDGRCPNLRPGPAPNSQARCCVPSLEAEAVSQSRAARKIATRAPKVAVKRTPAGPPAPATETPIPAAQAAPAEERIGVVTHYYSHLSVATVRLESG